MVANPSEVGTVRYPRCPSCGTVNAEGAPTCSRCGASLQRSDAVQPTARSAAPNQVTCANCHNTLPIGSKFCGYCGKPLVAAAPAASVPVGERGSPAREPLPPVFVPPASPVPSPPSIPPPRPAAAAAPASTSGSVPSAPIRPSRVENEPEADATVIFRGFRLRKVEASVTELRPDGADGRTVAIDQELTVGRENCTMNYPDDGVLSAAHASLAIRDGRVYLKDLQSQNGTFVRQHGDAELAPGDVFLLGRDLFRFAALSSEDQALGSSSGTPAASAPQRAAAAGELEHIQLNGDVIQVFRLEKPETILGRMQGDLVFQNDPYMSATHARIVTQRGRLILQDLESKNGIYRRIRGEVELNDGDQFFLGEQLFKVQVKTIQP